MVSLYYGYWDYWNLYHKVTFDGINKLILINEGVTDIDVQRDIYSAWKEWSLLETNTRYLQALDTVGGEPTVAGQRLDVTYFLINGWKLKPYPGTYNLNIVGNIFDVNGGDIKVPADIIRNTPNNITINLNTSVIVRQVDSTGGGTGEYDQDFADINTQLVTIDNRLISIQSTLSQPIDAQLVSPQSDILTELQLKINEIWKLHGLDITNPLLVTQTSRTAGSITQTILTTGSTTTQQTIVTRNT